jgi:hypothetical protein
MKMCMKVLAMAIVQLALLSFSSRAQTTILVRAHRTSQFHFFRILSHSTQVTVGVKGSFFDPPLISAREGDMVQFVFGGV